MDAENLLLPQTRLDGGRFQGSAGGKYTPRSRGARALSVLLAAFSVAIGSVALLMAISWFRSQGAVSVVRAQVEAMREGKIEAAYGFFSKSYQAETSLAMFRRWLRHQDSLASVQDLQIWGRSVWGETAVLWGSFQDDLGHRYPVRFLLVRENGSWRVDSLQLQSEAPESPPHIERFLNI